jgi:hypothetical protein
MNTTTELSSILRRTLDQANAGVVGLVDAVLKLCWEHNLQLDWQTDVCFVRPSGGDWEELADLSIRKSVFRAILARVSALCHEQSPSAFSPYGGRARLSVGENPSLVFQVTVANTPAEQRLEIVPEIGAMNAPREDS